MAEAANATAGKTRRRMILAAITDPTLGFITPEKTLGS
jgi:hypothetical protein